MIIGKHEFVVQVAVTADSKQVEGIAKYYGLELPAEYIQILMTADGFEGTVHEPNNDQESTYLAFYPASKVIENNSLYNIPEFEPNLMLIGTDMGGEMYFLAKSTDPNYSVPWVRLPSMDIGSRDPLPRLEDRFKTLSDLIDFDIQEKN